MSFTETIKVCGPRSCDQRLSLKSVDDHAVELMEILDRFHWHDVTFITLFEDVSENWLHLINRTTEVLRATKRLEYMAFHKNVWRIMDFFEDAIDNSTAIVFYGRTGIMENLFHQMEGFLLKSYYNNPILFPHQFQLYYKVTEALKKLPWLRAIFF